MLSILGMACGARSELSVGEELAPDAALDVALDAAPAEVCDGLDNDGDGEVDEGTPPQRCGVGSCARESPCGVACVPGSPETEVCGGRDEDCDGNVDEGLGLGPLGSATEIRNAVGGYDACSTCRWTLYSAFAPTDEGYLAIWVHGISGGEEIPNVWARRLGPDLNPLAPPEPVLPGVTLLWVGAISRATVGGETLVRAVERVGTGDLSRFLRVSASGTVSLEEDWLTTPREATYGPRNLVFTGERMVGVTWERAGFRSMEDNRLRITSANFDGSDRREFEVPAPYSRGGNLSSYGGRVAIRSYVVDANADPIARWTEFLVLDQSGMPQGELFEVDITYTTWARWIAREDAIRFWNTTTRTPTERFALSWSGERTEGPLLFEDERRLGDSGSGDAVLEEDSSFALMWQPREGTEFRLEVRNNNGEQIREGRTERPPHPTSPDGAYLGHPELRRRGGEYHALWSDGAEDNTPNRIWVQRFGCVE